MLLIAAAPENYDEDEQLNDDDEQQQQEIVADESDQAILNEIREFFTGMRCKSANDQNGKVVISPQRKELLRFYQQAYANLPGYIVKRDPWCCNFQNVLSNNGRPYKFTDLLHLLSCKLVHFISNGIPDKFFEDNNIEMLTIDGMVLLNNFSFLNNSLLLFLLIYYIEIYKDYLDHFQIKRKNFAKTEKRKESRMNKVVDLFTSNSINNVAVKPCC